MDKEMKERILDFHKKLRISPDYLDKQKIIEELFPEAFEQDSPLPGEVWISKHTDLIWIVTNDGALYSLDMKARLSEFTENSIEKLASSLEEYFRMKFEKDLK